MSYATYSEVYLAINNEDKHCFKIGETTNTRRRGKQLGTYVVTHCLDLESFYYHKHGGVRQHR